MAASSPEQPLAPNRASGFSRDFFDGWTGVD
jgi:hypothetical protein